MAAGTDDIGTARPAIRRPPAQAFLATDFAAHRNNIAARRSKNMEHHPKRAAAAE
jgi:hypothetical protein